MAIEQHPYWQHGVSDMRSLLLGSFPPHRKKWDFDFYYPNSQNLMWKVLSKISGLEIKHWSGDSAVQERLKILEFLKLGMQDIAATIDRSGDSAADSKIKIVEYQDILTTIRSTTLKAIIINGFSAQSSSYRGFLKYLSGQFDQKVSFTTPLRIEPMAQFILTVDGRSIVCILCNSTSPVVRRVGVTFDSLLGQYQEAISLGTK